MKTATLFFITIAMLHLGSCQTTIRAKGFLCSSELQVQIDDGEFFPGNCDIDDIFTGCAPKNEDGVKMFINKYIKNKEKPVADASRNTQVFPIFMEGEIESAHFKVCLNGENNYCYEAECNDEEVFYACHDKSLSNIEAICSEAINPATTTTTTSTTTTTTEATTTLEPYEGPEYEGELCAKYYLETVAPGVQFNKSCDGDTVFVGCVPESPALECNPIYPPPNTAPSNPEAEFAVIKMRGNPCHQYYYQCFGEGCDTEQLVECLEGYVFMGCGDPAVAGCA